MIIASNNVPALGEGSSLRLEVVSSAGLERVRGGAASRLRFLLEPGRVILWDEPSVTTSDYVVHQSGSGNTASQGLTTQRWP
ncbi:hypothetical protein [Thermosulfurimonas sp.]|uniref:hypothetical protein n=1 Tax=Thermosulfurimonas sp. TaxID=2080236 RepID=UPI0025FB8200|nr:hypothetical protein [Thermosulfurimonas sp.]